MLGSNFVWLFTHFRPSWDNHVFDKQTCSYMQSSYTHTQVSVPLILLFVSLFRHLFFLFLFSPLFFYFTHYFISSTSSALPFFPLPHTLSVPFYIQTNHHQKVIKVWKLGLSKGGSNVIRMHMLQFPKLCEVMPLNKAWRNLRWCTDEHCSGVILCLLHTYWRVCVCVDIYVAYQACYFMDIIV